MQTRYMMKVLLTVFMFILFSGCGGTKPAPVVVKKVVPAWVNAPLPQDTKLYMYGMGIEETRELAIKSALSDMVAKLGTTIESSYESNQVVHGSYSNLVVKNQIKSDVAKIKVNNYTVVESAKISYREFAVMLRSDKQKFVLGLKQNLKMSEKSISEEYKAVKSSDTLSRYNTKKELSQNAYKLLTDILIISELDSSFNVKKYLDFVDTKRQQYLQETKNLKFFVSGNTKSQKFVDNIKNHLAQNGYSVTNSKHNSLHVKIQTKDRVSRGDIAVVTMNVSVYNKSSRVGGKSFILKERYNGSMEGVYKNASIHLNQDIKALGINEVLGINLKMD